MLCGVGLKNTPIKHKNKKGDLVVCVFFLIKKRPFIKHKQKHKNTKTQPQNLTCKYDPGGHICTPYKVTNLDTTASTQIILMDLDVTCLPQSYGNGFPNDASTTRKYGKRLPGLHK